MEILKVDLRTVMTQAIYIFILARTKKKNEIHSIYYNWHPFGDIAEEHGIKKVLVLVEQLLQRKKSVVTLFG